MPGRRAAISSVFPVGAVAYESLVMAVYPHRAGGLTAFGHDAR